MAKEVRPSESCMRAIINLEKTAFSNPRGSSDAQVRYEVVCAKVGCNAGGCTDTFSCPSQETDLGRTIAIDEAERVISSNCYDRD